MTTTDFDQFEKEFAGVWIVSKVASTAASVNQPLRDSEVALLYQDIRTLPPQLTEAVQLVTTKVVAYIRYAIAADKNNGEPVIAVRKGLTLPVLWQHHYELLYGAGTSVPWLIQGIMQVAFFGNPAAGERRPWKHTGGVIATAEQEAEIRLAAQFEAMGAHRMVLLDETMERGEPVPADDVYQAAAPVDLTAVDEMFALGDPDVGWERAVADLCRYCTEEILLANWHAISDSGLGSARRPVLLWKDGDSWIAVTPANLSWVVSASAEGVLTRVHDIGSVSTTPLELLERMVPILLQELDVFAGSFPAHRSSYAKVAAQLHLLAFHIPLPQDIIDAAEDSVERLSV